MSNRVLKQNSLLIYWVIDFINQKEKCIELLNHNNELPRDIKNTLKNSFFEDKEYFEKCIEMVEKCQN